ncbi:4'-phosphopantetheinyl transferase superfamily protein [Arthrobacter cupressi]|uniref:4'-phosphopantetheinyl transferase n=1 Tax=Arthrobacter cupressi TaxID=1045773 RepID=A0A1G8S4T2_9MICC|nr:4'-phosphopantetheinyl transferase superfamily protein [Arthrobacter cupressi]NYD79408.1 4'-phosphopantetheinyl transferase [Arthrobacter cupressi]SDJ24238.1 4'-phosphopantetheinyl transferase [Arthrobacter cupressi]
MAGLALRLETLDAVTAPVAVTASVLRGAAGARAAAFAHERDRQEFLAGRAALLLFAAGLLEVDPGRLVARYDCPQCGPDAGHGRPAYLLDGGPAPLLLSASRAAGRVLLAGVAHPEAGTALGTDLEDSGRLAVAGFGADGFDAVALGAREQRWVQGLPAGERSHGRALLWARKEAWLKRSGEGLRRDPATVDALDLPGVADLALDGTDPGLELAAPVPANLVAAVAFY